MIAKLIETIEEAQEDAAAANALLHALGLYLDEIATQVSPQGINACVITDDWVRRAQAILRLAGNHVHDADRRLVAELMPPRVT